MLVLQPRVAADNKDRRWRERTVIIYSLTSLFVVPPVFRSAVYGKPGGTQLKLPIARLQPGAKWRGARKAGFFFRVLSLWTLFFLKFVLSWRSTNTKLCEQYHHEAHRPRERLELMSLGGRSKREVAFVSYAAQMRIM